VPLSIVEKHPSVSTPDDGKRPLRIAFVVHEYNRRHGHSRYVAELASRYKARHDVHIFSTTFEEPEPERLTYHRVPSWRANVVTTLPTFFLNAAIKVRGPFDIVHAQGFCGPRQNVVTAHICNAAWFAAIDRYQVPQSWRKRVFRALATTAERFVYRPAAARRFIAVSQRVRRDLNQYHGLDDQTRVVYHGTDIERFHPRNRAHWREPLRRQLGLADTDVAALYVGDWQKAGAGLVDSLALIPHVKLIVVTRTPEAMVRAEARAAGVEDRLLFLPPTDEIQRYYAAADLFLFPTFYDTFGLVLTEAMASGLPAITNLEAGAAELIVAGESGLLTDDPWEPRAIAAHLQTLAADESLRNRMGAAARTTVERRTWDEVAAETLAVYEEVVAEDAGTKRADIHG
jgi:UDP-glucose:(heptosyl)LPS alpha-1,3-glucosyltransferase